MTIMSHSEPITEGITFVEANEVAERLQAEGNFVIIDVREPDEISRDGKISRNVNIPSANFKDSEIAKNILLEHKDKDEIVVHCIKSQHRGPTCALALTQALERLKQEEVDTLKLPEIKVLRGGYHEFHSRFGETNLVEK